MFVHILGLVVAYQMEVKASASTSFVRVEDELLDDEGEESDHSAHAPGAAPGADAAAGESETCASEREKVRSFADSGCMTELVRGFCPQPGPDAAGGEQRVVTAGAEPKNELWMERSSMVEASEMSSETFEAWLKEAKQCIPELALMECETVGTGEAWPEYNRTRGALEILWQWVRLLRQNADAERYFTPNAAEPAFFSGEERKGLAELLEDAGLITRGGACQEQNWKTMLVGTALHDIFKKAAKGDVANPVFRQPGLFDDGKDEDDMMKALVSDLYKAPISKAPLKPDPWADTPRMKEHKDTIKRMLPSLRYVAGGDEQARFSDAFASKVNWGQVVQYEKPLPVLFKDFSSITYMAFAMVHQFSDFLGGWAGFKFPFPVPAEERSSFGDFVRFFKMIKASPPAMVKKFVDVMKTMGSEKTNPQAAYKVWVANVCELANDVPGRLCIWTVDAEPDWKEMAKALQGHSDVIDAYSDESAGALDLMYGPQFSRFLVLKVKNGEMTYAGMVKVLKAVLSAAKEEGKFVPGTKVNNFEKPPFAGPEGMTLPFDVTVGGKKDVRMKPIAQIAEPAH